MGSLNGSLKYAWVMCIQWTDVMDPTLTLGTWYAGSGHTHCARWMGLCVLGESSVSVHTSSDAAARPISLGVLCFARHQENSCLKYGGPGAGLEWRQHHWNLAQMDPHLVLIFLRSLLDVGQIRSSQLLSIHGCQTKVCSLGQGHLFSCVA